MKSFDNIITLKELPAITVLFFLLGIFCSLKISYLIFFNEYTLTSFLFLAYIIIWSRHQSWFYISKQSFVFLLLLLSGLLFSTRGNINSYVGVMLFFTPLVFFSFLKSDYRISMLYYFEKVFSIVIVVSLIWWVLFLLGAPLPMKKMEWGNYVFHDYYLFIYVPSLFYAFPRFQSIFIEPGYFGCLCVLMIFLRRFSFRCWQSYVYLLALILSYSMAGYLLFFIGYLLYGIVNKSGKIINLLVFSSLLLVFFYLVFSGEDNAISSMFAYRLQMDEGKVSGYNRTTKAFDAWWDSYFIQGGNWIFGNNDIVNSFFSQEDMIGVDLRVFVARYGIFPLVFYFGSMVYYSIKSRSRLAICYMLLFIIIYYRGYSTMFYMGFPILFVIGTTMLSHSNYETRRGLKMT